MTKPSFSELESHLGYSFSNISLLERAMTHRSVGPDNNERYEFFGDAILGVIISEYLFAQFPTASEGQLTRLRAKCVKKETLSEIAKRFSIENYIVLGPGEKQTGGAQRSSIQADAMEAIIAAITLEADLKTAKACILKWYAPILGALTLKDEKKDPKTQLQEWLQSKKLALPEYELEDCQGPDHRQHFVIRCQVEGQDNQIGEGKSRRVAEQEAARKMMEAIRASKS
jgi:ribonuclease-3